jgi:hypothetical protein
MLKVELGDIIRSYDFKPMYGRSDCYVEGKVLETNNTEMGYQAYKIEVLKDQFGNDEQTGTGSRVGEIVFVPWRVSFSEYQGRVINLSRL